ncbi:MAG: HlyD family efflux transporter periplasmic adaptor subunit, partial [Bacteroidales bacterium]|nr:HlyD family efflux transporter periplasmic adaptor subunit [Bacteroidales bacterium]
MKSLSIAIGIILIAVLIAKYFAGQKEPMKKSMRQNQQSKVVSVSTVKNSKIISEIPITGRVSALDYNEVFAEVGGILKPGELQFREGIKFKKGDILLRIDNTEARLNLLAAKSNFMNSLTQIIADIKLDYPDSYKAWERYLAKLNIKKSLTELPEPRSDKEKYFLVARNIYNTFYSIRSQEVRLSKYIIKADYDGIITQANIHPGTLVRIGQKLGEYINPSAYELEAGISQNDLGFVGIGNSV